jgi:hypothetical protein
MSTINVPVNIVSCLPVDDFSIFIPLQAIYRKPFIGPFISDYEIHADSSTLPVSSTQRLLAVASTDQYSACPVHSVK